MISDSYLLIATPPFYEDSLGNIWLDELWYRDLIAHLDHIQTLTVLSVKDKKPNSDEVRGIPLVRLDESVRERLFFAGLPKLRSGKLAPLNFLTNIPRVLRAIRKAKIIHSGVAGWPYPIGLIANPISLLLKKKLVIVVESSPWRLANPRKASRIAKLRESLNERFAKWSVKVADLAVFTSPGYLDTLGEPENGSLLLTPANWVKQSDLLPQASAKKSWQNKAGRLKVICPTRLVADKGIPVLLNALQILDEAKVDIQVDFIGQGDLEESLTAKLSEFRNIQGSLLPPVPYGEPFFSLLRQYDLLIAPTLGDEQPRIIFDAYSQALPVLASNSRGQEFLIEEGQTGAIYWRTDPEDLARSISSLTGSRDWLRTLGMNALEYAANQSHEAMHARRATALEDMLKN